MIEPVPKELSAIECLELAKTMMMAGVMMLLREARTRAGAEPKADPR